MATGHDKFMVEDSAILIITTTMMTLRRPTKSPVPHSKIIRRTSQGHHQVNNDDTIQGMATGHDEVKCSRELGDPHHHDHGDDPETSDKIS